MALNAQQGGGTQIGQTSSSSGGELHWLQPDPTAYQGNISWANVLNQSSPTPQLPLLTTTDWTVQVDGWTATVSNSSNALVHEQSSPAIVEPYFPEIYLPFQEANSICAFILTYFTTTI